MRSLRAALIAASMLAATAAPAFALTDEQEVVGKAETSFEQMRSSGDFTEMHRLLARAKAVIIVPSLVKAGFIFGGEGGEGVMFERTGKGWTGPAFYAIGGASVGFQAGVQSAEVVLVIMTQKGLDSVLDSKVKLGADASVAIGTIGKGVGAGTGVDTNADIYALARTEGLFGGAALSGSVISAGDEANEAVYGKGAKPRGILSGRGKPVALGARLRADLAKG